MKKVTFTIALFSLVVLTSFTTIKSAKETGDDDDSGTPTTTTTTADRTDTGGGQIIHDHKKKQDIIDGTVLPMKLNYINSTQNMGSRKKSDF